MMLLSPERVNFYNSEQVFQCHTQVYSRTNNWHLVENILKEYPTLGTAEWDAATGIHVNGERVI